jgi:hypothetical protein
MELQEMEVTMENKGKVKVAVRCAIEQDCLVLTKKLENASCDVKQWLS